MPGHGHTNDPAAHTLLELDIHAGDEPKLVDDNWQWQPPDGDRVDEWHGLQLQCDGKEFGCAGRSDGNMVKQRWNGDFGVDGVLGIAVAARGARSNAAKCEGRKVPRYRGAHLWSS